MSVGQLFTSSAPYGWQVLAACLLGIAAGGVGLVLVLVLRSEGRKPALLAALLPIGCLVLLAVTALDGVAAARASLVAAFDVEPSLRAVRIAEAAMLQLSLLALAIAGGSVLFVWIGLVLVTPSMRLARRRGRAWIAPLLVPVGLSLAPVYVAGQGLGYVWHTLASFSAVSAVPPAEKTAGIAAGLLAGAAQLAAAQHTAVTLAIVGGVLALVGAAWLGRGGVRASQPLLAGAGALWLAGFSAWVGTRAMAKDREPLPVMSVVAVPYDLLLPPFARCPAPPSAAASQLWFDPDGRAVFDGRVVALGELRSEAQKSAGRDVLIVAAASTPMARVRPYLAALKDAGARAILLAANRQQVVTATVGTLHRATQCGLAIAPSAIDETRQAPHSTWGELAAALAGD